MKKLILLAVLAAIMVGIPAMAQEQPNAIALYFNYEALQATQSWFGYGPTPRPYILVHVPHGTQWAYVEVTFFLQTPEGANYTETKLFHRAVGLPSTVFAHYVPAHTKMLRQPRITPLFAGDEIPAQSPGAN